MLEETKKQDVTDEVQTAEEITEETLKAFEEEKKAYVGKQHAMSEEEQKRYKELLEIANAPVEIDDDHFELGENELDIRKLSKKNKEQMHFRQGALQLVYLKAISSSLVDIIRLLMIVADKLGIEDIIAATDEIIEKTASQHSELKGKVKTKDDEEPTTEN